MNDTETNVSPDRELTSLSRGNNIRDMDAAQIPAFKGYNLWTAAKSVISKYAVFSGRATRSEYWYWILGQIAALLLLDMAFAILMFFLVVCGNSQQMNSSGIFIYCLTGAAPILAWGLFTLVPSLAVTCRRLHDTNKSGILLLLHLIPVVGGILLLVYCLEDSQHGTNQYGPSEKYPELPS